MILNKEILIKVPSCKLKYYLCKGYTDIKVGDNILLKIEDLTKGSGIYIDTKCDICGKIGKLQYYNYNKSITKYNEYYCIKCSKINTKKTNNIKYGCDYPLQNNNIINISKTTLLNKYGVDNISKLESVKNDRKNNFKLNNFKEKSKITLLNKYGVDNISKLKSIKNKKYETTLKNWGVGNPSQSSVLFEKSQISGKKIKLYDKLNIYYRGTYEFDFLNFCYENNIKIEKGKKIKYIFENKIKYYHSDFYLPKYNLICEIKSDYYYNLYLSKNLTKKEYTINNNFNFLFIINKNYNELKKIIKL